MFLEMTVKAPEDFWEPEVAQEGMILKWTGVGNGWQLIKDMVHSQFKPAGIFPLALVSSASSLRWSI